MRRFEIVQTDDGWHARTIGGNGEKVLWSENYTERRTALDALKMTAQLFSVTPAYFDLVDGVFSLFAGGMRVEVRDVDERTAGDAHLSGCDTRGGNWICADGCPV